MMRTFPAFGQGWIILFLAKNIIIRLLSGFNGWEWFGRRVPSLRRTANQEPSSSERFLLQLCNCFGRFFLVVQFDECKALVFPIAVNFGDVDVIF